MKEKKWQLPKKPLKSISQWIILWDVWSEKERKAKGVYIWWCI